VVSFNEWSQIYSSRDEEGKGEQGEIEGSSGGENRTTEYERRKRGEALPENESLMIEGIELY
jgi:hypothetical protein